MSFQHRFRLGLRHVGIDLARDPSSDPMFGVVQLLAHFGIDCVIDGGGHALLPGTRIARSEST